MASLIGHDKVVQILLDKGADVNAQSGPYSDTLQAALTGGCDEVVQILLEKGAIFEKIDSDDSSSASSATGNERGR